MISWHQSIKYVGLLTIKVYTIQDSKGWTQAHRDNQLLTLLIIPMIVFHWYPFPQVNPKDLYLLPTQLQPSQYTFSPLHLPDRNPSHFSQLALQTKLLTYFKRVSLSLGSVIITVTSSAYAVRNNGLNGLQCTAFLMGDSLGQGKVRLSIHRFVGE